MNVYNIIKEKEAFVDRWFDISLDYTVEDIINKQIYNVLYDWNSKPEFSRVTLKYSLFS